VTSRHAPCKRARSRPTADDRLVVRAVTHRLHTYALEYLYFIIRGIDPHQGDTEFHHKW
jgi:hypothetical protein